MKKVTSLNDVLMEQLMELCHGQREWQKLLSQLAQASSSTGLKNVFEHDLKGSSQRSERLKNYCKVHKTKPLGMVCRVIKEFGTQVADVINNTPAGVLRDAALIGLAQRMKHFLIEEHGSAREHASSLRLSQITELLDEILNEERSIHLHFSELAQGFINVAATRGSFY